MKNKDRRRSSFYIITGEQGYEEWKRTEEEEQKSYIKGYYKHNIKC